MMSDTPSPEELERVLDDRAAIEVGDVDRSVRVDHVRAENVVAAKYWGGFQPRIIATFLLFSVCWGGVLYLGATGRISLWLGLLLNSVFASTFYMPMHEAAHRNIWGRSVRGRRMEDVVGALCSIPTGIEFSSHRAGHMRHHAHTNDPARDPDHFTEGPLRDLPKKFYGMTLLYAFLPFFALIRPLRVLLPKALRAKLSERDGSKAEGKAQLRYWLLSTIVLVVCAVVVARANPVVLVDVHLRVVPTPPGQRDQQVSPHAGGGVSWVRTTDPWTRSPRVAPPLPTCSPLPVEGIVERDGARPGRQGRSRRGPRRGGYSPRRLVNVVTRISLTFA
ncbi:MAG: fatty acid desaturase [Ilumatobacteraceae bacterium]|nr:fatty acid desaturase [Ilumatobacteraceae bacterium]